MKKNLLILLCLLFAIISCDDDKEKSPSEKQLAALAYDAYVYAFAAVENNKAIGDLLADSPVNRFVGKTDLAGPEDLTVVTPNNDTYYAAAVLDLRAEPVVITVPLIEDRYFSIQLVDIFTNCPDYIGSRSTGTGPGKYLVAPSNWNDPIPLDLHVDDVIKVSSTIIYALARTQAFSDPDEQAINIQKEYEITPLSQLIETEPKVVDELNWPAVYDAKTGNIEDFFNMFNYMVQFYIQNNKDKKLMADYKVLGIKPGEVYDPTIFSQKQWEAIELGAESARSRIEASTQENSNAINGWTTSPENSGRWGDDYSTRSKVAWQYIYVNTLEEAVYYTGLYDIDGFILDASDADYTITFPNGTLPTPEFFWSVTMYNKSGFLVENDYSRYCLSSRMELESEDDGSIVMYIGKDLPKSGKTTNWLPAPDEQFYLVFRIYGPDEDTISGKYSLPGVVKSH
ncbi:DUF1254 domain-containing protein [Bacteroidales bacterium OttesenSCG-928-M11]|nr:DUF1254 domain-containing protein [Bacteroidales bacterium OttesenSCG-928-M11]